jgi:hypothetical protein
MESAKLLPVAGENVHVEIVERTLRAFVSREDIDTGIVAHGGLARERILTSIQEDEEDFVLSPLWGAGCWLSPDNPFLTEKQKGPLDKRGIVQVGTVLQSGDILFSALRNLLHTPGPKRNGKCWVRDRSCVVFPEWEGAVVTSVQVTQKRSEGVSREYPCVRIAIRAEYDLSAGDILLCQQEPIGVVARLIPDEEIFQQAGHQVDLVLPRAIGQRLGMAPGSVGPVSLGKAADPAAWSVVARSMSDYTAISKQPAVTSACMSTRIGCEHVAWLQSRGFFANLAELTSLKSDDLGNRSLLRELLKSGTLRPELIPEPGAPESLLFLQQWLRGLSLEAKFGKANHAVALSIRPASPEDILGWSSGQVISDEWINFRNATDMEGGIFCPRIFGSPDYPRRRRSGHIVLEAPVISLLWRLGTPSVLETLLAVPTQTIESILHHEMWVHRVADRWEVIPAEPESELPSDFLTGALAIESMLKSVPSSRLPAGLNGRPDVLAQRVIPVVPPEFRPWLLTETARLFSSDLNELYRRLMKRAVRLFKLKNWPSAARNETRYLQRNYDHLLANCLLPEERALFRETDDADKADDDGEDADDADSRYCGFLDCLFKRLDGKNRKAVDWCGKARAVASSLLPKDVVQIPDEIYDTLHLEPHSPVLLTTGDGSEGTFIALLPRRHGDRVLVLPPGAYSRLGMDSGIPECIVHRPLGVAACAEARRLLDHDPGPIISKLEDDQWTGAVEPSELAHQLAQAALAGTTVSLQSPRCVLVGGTGASEFAEDSDLSRSSPDVCEVDEPS